MQILLFFLIGFSFTYTTNVLDLLSQLFEAKIALKITKINSQIKEWCPQESYDDPYRVGFMCQDTYDEEYYDEDEWDN